VDSPPIGTLALVTPSGRRYVEKLRPMPQAISRSWSSVPDRSGCLWRTTVPGETWGGGSSRRTHAVRGGRMDDDGGGPPRVMVEPGPRPVAGLDYPSTLGLWR